MPIDYTYAKPVEEGEALTSAAYNRLAMAFNDRLKAGVGDPVWRLFWYAHSLFRGIRKPSGTLTPPEDEWWKIYQHITQASGITWPTASPGAAAGVNTVNPMGAFVFGRTGTIDAEDERLDDIPEYNSAPGGNEDYWTFGKNQRGLVHRGLDNLDEAHALRWAAAGDSLQYDAMAFFLKNYGGWIPAPGLTDPDNPLCSDNQTHDFTIRFTALTEGLTDKSYSTCPSAGVLGYYERHGYYHVVKLNGTTETLKVSDYLEGPYKDNARLSRYSGDQLTQALNWFVSEFRGSTGQRDSADMNRLTEGFDFQAFMTRQYALAPAFAWLTDSNGNLIEDYTSFSAASGDIENTLLTHDGTETKQTAHDGFVIAGYFAKVTGSFSGQVELVALREGVAVASHTLTTSSRTALHWLESAQSDIEFRLAADLPSGASLTVETAELMDYKPNLTDAYALLRLATSLGNSGVDRHGLTEPTPKTIGTQFLQRGCIISPNGIGTQTHLTNNPVYEMARRLFGDGLRMLDRQELTGYEVIDDNGIERSVLYFHRYSALDTSNEIDLMADLAPNDGTTINSGDLVPGESYHVTGGSITWNSQTIAANGTFTVGASDPNTFTPANQYSKVQPLDGIRSTPIKDNRKDRFRGQTSEWVMSLSTCAYNPSTSSTYKPSAYADIQGFLTDRCTLLSDAWKRAGMGHVLRHTHYGQKPVIRPENPSGYRYLEGSHSHAGSQGGYAGELVQGYADDGHTMDASWTEHYKSCQLYTPPYTVHSVRRTGHGTVKVTLTGRLDHHAAPSTIANNLSAWQSALTGSSHEQTRRSDENAVLEYLIHASTSTSHCGLKIGDTAPDAWVHGDFKGNCYPRFYFARLIRHVYNDDNDTRESHDTPVFMDEFARMELALQAMCSGFIDAKATLDFSCDNYGRLFDYTYPNLCSQTGIAWPGPIPHTVDIIIDTHRINWSSTFDEEVYLWIEGRNDSKVDAWEYWNGTDWVTPVPAVVRRTETAPLLLTGPDRRAEYRVRVEAKHRSPWLLFLPPAVRPDRAQGFAPLPNTLFYGRMFNQLANGVNRLCRARVDLPFALETRDSGTRTWVKDAGTEIKTASGSDADYSGTFSDSLGRVAHYTTALHGFASGTYHEFALPNCVTAHPAASAWGAGETQAIATVGIDVHSDACSGSSAYGLYVSGESHMTLTSAYRKVQYRIVDDILKHALHPTWRDQFLQAPGILAEVSHQVTRHNRDDANGDPGFNDACLPARAGLYPTHGWTSTDEELIECRLLENPAVFSSGQTYLELDPKQSPLWQEFIKEGDWWYAQTTQSGGGAEICSTGNSVTMDVYGGFNNDRYVRIPLVERDYPEVTP